MNITAKLQKCARRVATARSPRAVVSYATLMATLTVPAWTPAHAAPSGIWRSRGYGIVADFSGREPRIYDLTAVSCLPSASTPYLEQAEFKTSRGTLTAELDVDAVPIVFERLAALPVACRRGGSTHGDVNQVDPRLVLSVLCANFEEQYAFSALHQVNFPALCAAAQKKLKANTSPSELWATLTALIDHTEDDHVTLSSSTDPSLFHSAAPPSEIALELSAEFEQQSSEPDPAAFQAAVLARIVSNTESYLTTPVHDAAEGLLRWARIGTQAGYIAIDGMASPLEAASGSEDVELFAQGIDEALSDVRDLPVVVVDLRLNQGGFDPVSLALASRFSATRTLGFTVQARDGNGLTPAYPVFVKAAATPYTGHVILLTSELSVSAAETFLLAMLERPNTYRVGETSAGFFSDMLPRALPNGWVVTLSNERYRAADGKAYEGIGLAPHVPIDCFNKAERDAGRDYALEAALALAQKSGKTRR